MEAPTIPELLSDLQRQEVLKERARLADAKWEAKGRIIAGPESVESTVERLGAGAARRRAEMDGQGRSIGPGISAGEEVKTEVGRPEEGGNVIKEGGKEASGEARERAEREIMQDGGDETTKPEDPWAKADRERAMSGKIEGAINLAPARREVGKKI
jgi:hypothetical protein